MCKAVRIRLTAGSSACVARVLAAGLLCIVFQVFEDEDDFAGTYETKVAAGKGFNRGGIFVQPAHLLAKRGVLAAKLFQRGLELLILPSCIHRLHQALFADECVDDEYDSDENEQNVEAALANDRGGCGDGAITAYRVGAGGAF
jgi:hypothetical protein